MIITSHICVYPTYANIIYPPFSTIACVQSLILNSTYAVSSKTDAMVYGQSSTYSLKLPSGATPGFSQELDNLQTKLQKILFIFYLSRKKVRWRRGRNYYSLFLVWTQFCPKGLLPCLIENSGMPIRCRRDCRPNERCPEPKNDL